MQQQRVFLVPSEHVGWIAVRAELAKMERVAVVGEAINAQKAIAAIETVRPNVVIAAEVVENMPIRTLLTNLRLTSCPRTRLIVFAPRLDPDTVMPFAEIGVAGYIFWDSLSCNGLAGCLTTMMECNVRIGSEEAVQVLTQTLGMGRDTAPNEEIASRKLDAPTYKTLTQQQRAVLRLVENGSSNRVVAEQLCISPKTVKKHLEDIYKRLGVHDRETAAHVAYERGCLAQQYELSKHAASRLAH